MSRIPNIDYSKLSIYTQNNVVDCALPIVVASPHSGTIFPEEFYQASALSLKQLRTTEDLFVDELLMPLADKGIPVIAMNIARAFIDVNRDKIELDEKMFDDYPADKIIFENTRCRTGYGLIHRIDANGNLIYRNLLSYNEVQKRIKNVYDVYHKHLSLMVNRCVQKFGICYLLDAHSMPSKICAIMDDDAKIDVCIGDLFSQSCPTDKSNVLINFLQNKGYSVVKNIPYSGGYTTFNYCQPRKNIYTLQIELNRALYCDEKKLLKNQNFEKIQQDLCACILHFASNLSTK